MIPEESKKNLREYYEQSYAIEFDNLEEIDNFLETYSPPKLNQEETEHFNRLISKNEIEYVIIILKNSLHKTPGQDGFTGEFY